MHSCSNNHQRPMTYVKVNQPKKQSNDIPLSLEYRYEDESEARAITAFLEVGCQCESLCYDFFSRSHYELVRSQCSELTHESLDLVVMGQLMALTPGGGRSAQCTFMHKGRQVNEFKKHLCVFTCTCISVYVC